MDYLLHHSMLVMCQSNAEEDLCLWLTCNWPCAHSQHIAGTWQGGLSELYGSTKAIINLLLLNSTHHTTKGMILLPRVVINKSNQSVFLLPTVYLCFSTVVKFVHMQLYSRTVNCILALCPSGQLNSLPTITFTCTGSKWLQQGKSFGELDYSYCLCWY